MTNGVLNGEIRRVASERGITPPNWSRLRRALNEAGVTAAKGNAWSSDIQIKRYCERHEVFGIATRHAEASEDITPARQAGQGEQGRTTQDLPSAPQEQGPQHTTDGPQLDPETAAALKEVVAWWKTTKGAESVSVTGNREIQEPPYRPNFPGERKNTGLRVNKQLLQDALDKARTPQEAVKTGGGISPLVEYLLWQYLGFDPKYLRKGD